MRQASHYTGAPQHKEKSGGLSMRYMKTNRQNTTTLSWDPNTMLCNRMRCMIGPT